MELARPQQPGHAVPARGLEQELAPGSKGVPGPLQHAPAAGSRRGPSTCNTCALDLLFASSGIEPELVAAATEEDLPGIGLVPVASRGHLIALKVLSRKDSGRPNDVLDLSSLICAADPSDLADARAAVKLIEERGFNRDRDLQALLAKAFAEFAAH